MSARTAESGSYVVPRVLAGVAALPFTALAMLMIGTSSGSRFDPMGSIFGALAAVVAILCWWFALRGQIAKSRARMRFAVMGGLVLGAIGFAAGFVGPIILKPGANQGPLLGIFVTGPLGFVLGVLIGWLYSIFRARGGQPTAPAGR